MNPDNACFEISCPECYNMLTLDLHYDDGKPSLLENLTHVLSKTTGEIKYYSFKGMKKCECGKMVLSSLAITTH